MSANSLKRNSAPLAHNATTADPIRPTKPNSGSTSHISLHSKSEQVETGLVEMKLSRSQRCEVGISVKEHSDAGEVSSKVPELRHPIESSIGPNSMHNVQDDLKTRESGLAANSSSTEEQCIKFACENQYFEDQSCDSLIFRPTIDDEDESSENAIREVGVAHVAPSEAGTRLQQISEITGWYAYFIAKELLEEAVGRRDHKDDPTSALTLPESLGFISDLQGAKIPADILAKDLAQRFTKQYETGEAKEAKKRLDAVGDAQEAMTSLISISSETDHPT